MRKSYREIGKQAEDAVRGIKDRDLRREAFRILLLQFIAGGNGGNGQGHRAARKAHAPVTKTARPAAHKRKVKIRPLKRPGRRGGGEGTVAIQKLIDAGIFRTGRDAAGIMKELARRRMPLEPSQLRMVLLRFSRARKLRRRVKMKGRKVTYLYSVR
ncbi:MAG: hypothetical protein A2W25_07010 [candidate division Zixibacteria bacterium RBG_16_53_22]|nr:MAG: hypothetical protein A2W25_07010 [candidate division Zixibacteria bacterium RBG_16_53_22]